MKLFPMIVAAIAGAILPSVATAAPIYYTLEGISSFNNIGPTRFILHTRVDDSQVGLEFEQVKLDYAWFDIRGERYIVQDTAYISKSNNPNFSNVYIGFDKTRDNGFFLHQPEFVGWDASKPFDNLEIKSSWALPMPMTDKGMIKLQDFEGYFKAGAAVPEPSTWMMMILGFGAVGYSLRRKTALRFI